MKYNNENKPLICMQTNSNCYKKTRPMKIVGVLWHSTGANNPNLKRYIQPLESQDDYGEMIEKIGKNQHNNDYNHVSYRSGLNAWIGKMSNGEVQAVQTMPWNFKPWGCGSGPRGSCNEGWIQFEICEDTLTDLNYFNQVYKEACELTAYLCKLYQIDPNGVVKVGNIDVPTILCHADSHRLGLGSNHGDVLHWFSRFNKDMNQVRQDITKLLMEDEEEMTQEQFNVMMNRWIMEQAGKGPSSWSEPDRRWAEKKGLIQGDEQGRKMYKKFLTREEMAALLHRALKDLI